MRRIKRRGEKSAAPILRICENFYDDGRGLGDGLILLAAAAG
jgi:hypothetical protein